jgi:hypothetical protein
MRQSHLQRGVFSPVEIAIAFVFIAFLAATALPGFLRARHRSLVLKTTKTHPAVGSSPETATDDSQSNRNERCNFVAT